MTITTYSNVGGLWALLLAAGLACNPGAPPEESATATDGVTDTGEPSDPTGGPTDPTGEPPKECSDVACGFCETCVDGVCEYDENCHHEPACYEDVDCEDGEVCVDDFDKLCKPLPVMPTCERQELALSYVDLQGPAAALVLADLDGDGDNDLAVARPGEVEVLLGDGLGGLVPGGVFPTGLGDGPQQLAAADFDGDGELDLAVLRGAPVGELALLFGQDAVFEPPVAEPLGAEPGALWAGDVDGDGHADLIARNAGAPTLAVRLGDGVGGFAEETTSLDGPLAAATVGDVDGDGALEAIASRHVVGQDRPVLDVHRWALGGFMQIDFLAGSGTTPYAAVMAADFDGDGASEVVAQRTLESVEVLITWSSGGDISERIVPAGARLGAVGDVDGDGHGDLATIEPSTGGVSVQFTGGINGGFECTQSYVTQLPATVLVAGDLDGDGKADIVSDKAGDQLAMLRSKQ